MHTQSNCLCCWCLTEIKGERKRDGGLVGRDGYFFFLCMFGGFGLFGELLASSSFCDEGRGPFSQLLVSSLSPPGMTAEAVAALPRPALPFGGNEERQTSRTVGFERPAPSV